MVNRYLISANKLMESTLVQGILNLLADIKVVFMVVAGLLTAVLFIWRLILHQKADDEEKPKYKKMAIGTLAVGVIITVAPQIVEIILSYFAG